MQHLCLREAFLGGGGGGRGRRFDHVVVGDLSVERTFVGRQCKRTARGWGVTPIVRRVAQVAG